MRSVDRLEHQRRIKKETRKSLPSPDEEMEEEMDRPDFVPLNKNRSIFENTTEKTFGGINTELSVFDKKAAIRTD